MAYSKDEQFILLKTAKSAIESALFPNISMWRPESVPVNLEKKQGCFVTLHKKGDLRGCIGSIEPAGPLIQCVEANAYNAAFRDPRFPPLSKEEFYLTDIEVSVLTRPKPLDFSDWHDLKQKLVPGKHGVILSRNMKSATFLPQVWNQLPDAESFLSHLCMKAMLEPECYKNPETRIQVYEAFYFQETKE